MVTHALKGAVLALSLVCGIASAQQKVEVVRAASRPQTSIEDVAQAAKAAGKGKQTTEKGFMETQSIRAARIGDAARKDTAAVEQLHNGGRMQAEIAKHDAWVRQELSRARNISDGAINSADAQQGGAAKRPTRPKFVVFVSQSMGQAGLKAAFEYGRGRTDVLYVFRGFLPKQSPLAFQGVMAKFQKKSEDQLVQIALDPPSFRDLGIKSVPAIAMLDPNEKLIAKVSGLVNYAWLKERVEAGEKGDLGNRGNTYRIAEEDLIAQMKAKAAALDHKKLANEAKARYFREMPTLELPYAKERRVRKIMPVLEVKSDIVDHQGVVRFKAGQRIDMKDQLPTAPMLVVFNSQDRYHVEFAKAMAAKAGESRKVIFITTHVDREGGIAGYAKQEYAIGRPVFVLMPDVKNTFGIERIPTVVTPTDNEFIVVEVPLTQGARGNAGTHSP